MHHRFRYPNRQTSNKVIAIGSDHGGFEMKESLIKELKSIGYEVD